MILFGIAVCVFGLLASVFSSYVFLCLSVFSFASFFIAWVFPYPLPVLSGFTIAFAVVLAVGMAILNHRESTVAAADPVVAEEAEVPSAAEEPAPVETEPLIPSPPEMFNIIRVDGIRYETPSVPEVFYVIKDIEW